MNIEQLAAQWLVEKQKEKDAAEARRDIEDNIKKLASISDQLEGVEAVAQGGYEIKISGRIDRKVDGEKVQELAAEFGLSEHLSRLFRWKPELNMSAWKSTDASITGPLASAITAKPGRPSFAITIKE